jgi:5-methylcytosine-specific restriction endonuclease McrA
MQQRSEEYWTDDKGVTRRVPTVRGRLQFQTPLHAALRAFVFRRDRFTCRWCGAKAVAPPADYDGRSTLNTDRMYDNRLSRIIGRNPAYLVMDHIVSRFNDGSHHPDNLQTLCDCCNSAKVSLVDRKVA